MEEQWTNINDHKGNMMNVDIKNIITFRCFLLFVLLTVCNHYLFAQHATVRDIVAGYKANAALFQGSRICYKLTLEKKFDDNVRNFEGVYDYWSDGQNLLLRGGDSKKIGNTENILSGQLPDKITSSDLNTIYEKIPVFSYDSEGKLGYRWSVLINGSDSEKNKGEIFGNVSFPADSEDFHCPPFLPLTFGKVGSGFPTDDFFSCAESDLFLLGTQVIDGKEYYVLESRVMSPEGYYQFQDKGMNLCSIRRAWIDIKIGCIPIRIEYLSARSKNGQLIDYTPSLRFSGPDLYSSIFEVQKIQKLGTGFYPVSVVHRFMRIPKERNEQIQRAFNESNDNDDVDIGDTPITFEVWLEYRWEVSKVIPDAAVDRETLILPFPKGTVLFDDRKGYETMLLEQSRSPGAVILLGLIIRHIPRLWNHRKKK